MPSVIWTSGWLLIMQGASAEVWAALIGRAPAAAGSWGMWPALAEVLTTAVSAVTAARAAPRRIRRPVAGSFPAAI
ncbi:hypothetical protein SGLAM104S_04357 [Streptomyces glaucescens]